MTEQDKGDCSTSTGAFVNQAPIALWITSPATGLEKQIADFKEALPGWWFSVCECQVSCDASCAPTPEATGFDVLMASGDDRFNSGFHADLPQPDTLAGALWCVMFDALVAVEKATA